MVISDLPVIKGVPFQVRQVFVNLFGNSIKYNQPGRPLRIEVSGNMVHNPGLGEVNSYVPNQFLKIVIRDNGIGFPQSQSEKIFDMFERLHNRDAFEGTGIGLSICRKVMDNHKAIFVPWVTWDRAPRLNSFSLPGKHLKSGVVVCGE